MPTAPTAAPAAAGALSLPGADAPAAAPPAAGSPAPVPAVRAAPVAPRGGPAYLHRALPVTAGPMRVGRSVLPGEPAEPTDPELTDGGR